MQLYFSTKVRRQLGYFFLFRPRCNCCIFWFRIWDKKYKGREIAPSNVIDVSSRFLSSLCINLSPPGLNLKRFKWHRKRHAVALLSNQRLITVQRGLLPFLELAIFFESANPHKGWWSAYFRPHLTAAQCQCRTQIQDYRTLRPQSPSLNFAQLRMFSFLLS